LEVVCYAGNGIFAPMADMFVAEDETPPILSYILIGLSVGAVIPATYSIADHIEGTNLAAQICQTIVSALGDAEQFKAYAPVLLTACALVAIITGIIEKANDDVDWAGFSSDFLSEIPTFVRPLQYLAQEFPFTTTITLATIDMTVNFATALADFIGLVQSWDTLDDPTPLPPDAEPPVSQANKSYLPFAATAP
jgi:hypothetical protein